jgi:hypothetical protein
MMVYAPEGLRPKRAQPPHLVGHHTYQATPIHPPTGPPGPPRGHQTDILIPQPRTGGGHCKYLQNSVATPAATHRVFRALPSALADFVASCIREQKCPPPPENFEIGTYPVFVSFAGLESPPAGSNPSVNAPPASPPRWAPHPPSFPATPASELPRTNQGTSRGHPPTISASLRDACPAEMTDKRQEIRGRSSVKPTTPKALMRL